MVSKILRLRSVIELSGLPRSTIYSQISQDNFLLAGTAWGTSRRMAQRRHSGLARSTF
jgi:hypothetical protein